MCMRVRKVFAFWVRGKDEHRCARALSVVAQERNPLPASVSPHPLNRVVTLYKGRGLYFPILQPPGM